MAKDDDSATTSKKGGFLSCMRAQAATHAANTTKLSSVTTNDTSVETPLALPIVPAQSPPITANDTPAETPLAIGNIIPIAQEHEGMSV